MKSHDRLTLAVVGLGKMGRALCETARSRGHTIAACIDPEAPEATSRALDPQALTGVDVVLEFTTPSAAPQTIRQLLSADFRVVSGTTGWTGSLPEMRQLAEKGQGALLWSPNFSIGVQFLFRLAARAAVWFGKAGGYEPFLIEEHHRMKKDGPSGTALRLGEIVLEGTPGKTRLEPAPPDRPVSPEVIPVAWIRAGAIPGNHRVGWDGPGETLEIVHRARDRGVFAHGAVLAAEWLAKRQGFFTVDDWMGDMLKEEMGR